HQAVPRQGRKGEVGKGGAARPAYLASQQAPDGHWDSADKVNKTAKGKPTPGKAKDVTITAFALLPFLARGETHKGSEAQHIYTKHVDAGVKFLLAHQGADGDLR